jgi:hypothetical protein
MNKRKVTSILRNVFHDRMSVHMAAVNIMYLAIMCSGYGTGEKVTNNVKKAAEIIGINLKFIVSPFLV